MAKKRSPRTEQQKRRDQQTRKSRELRRCKRSRSLQACRKAVFYSDVAGARAGKLLKSQLKVNRTGKIVSKRKSDNASRQYDRPGSGLRAWNEAARLAFDGGAAYSEVDDFDDLIPGVLSPSPMPSPPRPKRPSKRPKRLIEE